MNILERLARSIYIYINVFLKVLIKPLDKPPNLHSKKTLNKSTQYYHQYQNMSRETNSRTDFSSSGEPPSDSDRQGVSAHPLAWYIQHLDGMEWTDHQSPTPNDMPVVNCILSDGQRGMAVTANAPQTEVTHTGQHTWVQDHLLFPLPTRSCLHHLQTTFSSP